VTTAQRTAEPSAPRSPLRSVALPAEHGGWGLTLEPGLLGLLIAPSVAGACVAAAAMVAFLARTPLKLAAIDRRRGRDLARTRLARRVAAVEVAVLAALVAGAVLLAAPGFWIPGAVAAPLLAVEAWFDVRSRGRRLTPELAGAVGVSSVAAMVLLAGGEGAALALGAWALLAARSCTSIPHVRVQIARLRHKVPEARAAAAGNVAAVVLAASAVVLDHALAAGAVAVAAIIAVQQLALRRPVPRPVVLGMRQMAMGFGLVVVTAVGALVAT
jgi:hypothetical protein